ncbi:hypothetical protein K488DRAFT_87865 [Vararia minispora EC-137]|uniref:Uncharacterized protein n=1 Tax=Vararia minispora EC-137 TaxID=1314806 RepID=A0ACB8QFE3_9AGAM|nr:hypothetical protein K488DRAFT_87865 [Vararia minispora EC-137]
MPFTPSAPLFATSLTSLLPPSTPAPVYGLAYDSSVTSAFIDAVYNALSTPTASSGGSSPTPDANAKRAKAGRQHGCTLLTDAFENVDIGADTLKATDRTLLEGKEDAEVVRSRVLEACKAALEVRLPLRARSSWDLYAARTSQKLKMIHILAVAGRILDASDVDTGTSLVFSAMSQLRRG